MNTEKFKGMAQEYSKYRPAYPKALYKFLYENLNFTPDKIIADIGAGTGKFSLPFLENGLKVVCIEPNKDMKEKMDENLTAFINYTGICASAENTTLENNSIDNIVCAQAFHWFDRLLFKEECKRIMKTDGKVVLIWNVRNENDRVTQQLYKVNKKYCPDFKGFSGGIDKIDPYQFDDFFSDYPCNYNIFENNLFYSDSDVFIGKCLTGSYALKKDNLDYQAFVNELKNIYDESADKQGVGVKNNTVIYWGKL